MGRDDEQVDEPIGECRRLAVGSGWIEDRDELVLEREKLNRGGWAGPCSGEVVTAAMVDAALSARGGVRARGQEGAPVLGA